MKQQAYSPLLYQKKRYRIFTPEGAICAEFYASSDADAKKILDFFTDYWRPRIVELEYGDYRLCIEDCKLNGRWSHVLFNDTVVSQDGKVHY